MVACAIATISPHLSFDHRPSNLTFHTSSFLTVQSRYGNGCLCNSHHLTASQRRPQASNLTFTTPHSSQFSDTHTHTLSGSSVVMRSSRYGNGCLCHSHHLTASQRRPQVHSGVQRRIEWRNKEFKYAHISVRPVALLAKCPPIDEHTMKCSVEDSQCKGLS
ncbi:hypothetical protein J6590_016369 [Homalodisca vitripennis]|nr:hypothetical protein J6590_016369 [Homalodisca vitripennis]